MNRFYDISCESNKFGSQNLDLLLAAYNAGENLVERLGRVPQIRETVDYVRKIKTIYKPENGSLVPTVANGESTAEASASESQEPPTVIYSSVDDRGVIHFSNIGPPN